MKKGDPCRIVSSLVLAATVLTSVNASGRSVKKDDGGDARNGGCIIHYASNDCTGAPLIRVGDATRAGDRIFEHTSVIRVTGAAANDRVHNVQGGANECTNQAGALPIDCADFCVTLGYGIGTAEQANNVNCGGQAINNVGYCDCQTPGNSTIQFLSITSAALNQAVNACGTVTIQASDVNGAVNASRDMEIQLHSTGFTGGFYSDANCTTAITAATIAQNAASKTVYFKDSVAESAKIVAVFRGLPRVTQDYTVNTK